MIDWAEVVPPAVALLGVSVASTQLLRTVRRSTDKAEANYRQSLRITYGPKVVFEELRAASEAAPAQLEVINGEADPLPHGKTPPKLDGEPSLNPPEANDHRARLAALPIDYHAQVLAQSRQSFILSVGAAVVGFLVITIGVILAFVGTAPATIATMAGGVIAEAVAALFFTQSNRARSVMAGQLEGFREADEVSRQATERRDLIEMVRSPEKRDDLLVETVLMLAGRVTSERPGRPGDSPTEPV
ncbi:TRADD-N-associated membrane domain-containing protein [Nocardioides lianchengensis]|uniref:TRADD-N-associated membrane domain-containing protein n=1 Tax=Nocardioides lianchengensis TaxID=1045774 RepID=UPI001113B1DE|nr:hypothetical protein [Nocardioides lianchengensis]NYG12470.1 hypothetical protein [Nocardioides lianchengensis]